MRGLIEDEIASRQGEAGIRSLGGAEVMRSVADTSVALGGEAVKLTVGAVTTAAGGQGVSPAMEAVGASSEMAAVTDLAVTFSNNQPLDWVTREVDVALVSTDTQKLEVPSPVTTMTTDEAHRALLGSDDLSDDEDAILTLVGDVIIRSSTEGNGTGDKTISLDVPQRVHFSDHQNALKDSAMKIDIPRMGNAHLMVAPKGKPALITKINTSNTVELVYGKPIAPDGGGSVSDGGLVKNDSGVRKDSGGGSTYPDICRQAIACAYAALSEAEAKQFEEVFRENGQCFQSPVGDEVCIKNCQEAVTSWQEDGFC